ncbi:hypothetical protein ACFQXA_00840 [Nocardiopsis composta]
MPIWLFVLLAAGFVLYTDDYVIAGILPELAQELGVTEAQAGQLITVFSLTVALAAPVAAVAFARVPAGGCSPARCWSSSPPTSPPRSCRRSRC